MASDSKGALAECKVTLSTSPCPLCGIHFPSSSLQAHVNLCLDTCSPRRHQEEKLSDDHASFAIPSPPSSRQSSSSSLCETPVEAPSHTPPTVRVEPLCVPQQLSSWLGSLSLGKYESCFRDQGVSTLEQLYASLQELDTDSVLLNVYHVETLGARRKISAAIDTHLRAHTSDKHKGEKEGVELKPKEKSNASNISLDVKHETVWTKFTKQCKRGGASSGVAIASSSPVTKRQKLQFEAPASKSFNSMGKQPQDAKRKTHMHCQRVPGTTFTVDSFRAIGSDACTNYFLSHMHADHYGGLTKSALPSGSVVLCSEITAALVRKLLRVPDKFIRVLPMATPVRIEEKNDKAKGATVWLYAANHCRLTVVVHKHRRW